MEFGEHEDQEEEMEELQGYDPVVAANSSSTGRATIKIGPTTSGELSIPATTPTTSSFTRKSVATVRYRECLKNHAVGIGGHAVDGCGEFMAAGDEGTLNALKCAACSCHRNFHRKELPSMENQLVGGIYQHPPPPGLPHHLPPQFSSSYYRGPHPPPPPPHPHQPGPAGYLHLSAAQRPLALTAASGGGGFSREDMEEDVSNPSSSGGGGGSSSRKRFRTKFTQEQKDKMLAFAEQLGWRIQKHDDAAVESFCIETGVKRHVLKVWMHNNKHTLVEGDEVGREKA